MSSLRVGLSESFAEGGRRTVESIAEGGVGPSESIAEVGVRPSESFGAGYSLGYAHQGVIVARRTIREFRRGGASDRPRVSPRGASDRPRVSPRATA